MTTFLVQAPLTAAMKNDHAWKLGEIAADAGSPHRNDVGDYIDRGLILLRLLNEAGYEVIPKNDNPRNFW